MEEITLTGGTLMSSADKTANNGGNAAGSTHTHSHEHGHCHEPGHGNGNVAGDVEMEEISPSLEDLMGSSTDEIVKALSTLIRFGRYEAVDPILEQIVDKKGKEEVAEVFRSFDDGGHALLHWASKRVDDSRFIQKLVELVVELKIPDVLNAASADHVGMRPLHWACTEGCIPHVALLLKSGADLEAKDTSGCTPLLIAAQYGQVKVVAYLLQNGANIKAVDSSRDSALHWAAYKGSIQVCGLLSYYQTLDWSTQDTYGQTPIHLAALRGHTSVVHYILVHLDKKDVLFQKDKNERTPLDLAIHKSRPTVEAILKQAMSELEDPRAYFLNRTLLANMKEMVSIKTWKSWLGLSSGMDELDKPSKFPYYFVIFNYVVHIVIFTTVFAPFVDPAAGIMWDLSGWIMWNFGLTFASWYFFYKTVTTKPGYLDDSLPTVGKWRGLYEETLEAYADETNVQNEEWVSDYVLLLP
jgi:ankyrin repeat protein